MGFIKGFFPNSSDNSKRSAGALVFRSIASPFTRSSSRGSQEGDSSLSYTEYQRSPADQTAPFPAPPAQARQDLPHQTPPVSSIIEAAQLFDGTQNFHSRVDNSNTINGRTAQAWLGSQTFMDTVTNTNTIDQSTNRYGAGNVNSYISTGDSTTYYGYDGAPAASAPSPTSTPVSPTQVYDGSQTFRADLVNKNVGNGPAQLFNGDQEFFGVVSNTNIGTSGVASGRADTSAGENNAKRQTEALAEQMSSWGLEDTPLVPESHRLTASESVPISSPPFAAQTPAAPTAAPAPAQAASPSPQPPAAAKQVFEGSQRFHSAMYNTNTGSGAGQVFKGDQNFYGPMVNNNVTNSSTTTMNSDNVNSVIRDGTSTTYYSGHQSQAAGAVEYTLKQQGKATLGIEAAKIRIIDAQIQEIIQRGMRGPTDPARLEALQEIASSMRASILK